MSLVAISNDRPSVAGWTRERWKLDYPVLTTAGSDALDVLGIRHVGGHGRHDVAVPTLVLVDATGRVQRTYQSRQSHLRLSPDQVLAWL